MKCINCGLCKGKCPIYKVLLKEMFSPRGKAILKMNKIIDASFYLCTLCGFCKEECPVNYDLKILDEREKLVKEGKITKANKRILENIKKFGNPFVKL